MVSSSLLSYNISNIQVRYNITNATLSAGVNIPTHQLRTEQSHITQDLEHAQLRVDSTAFYASLGMRGVGAFIRNEAQQGRQAAMEFAATRAHNGEYLNHIEKGHTIAQLYRQKFLSEATDGTLVVQKAGEVETSFTPASASTRFTPMQVSLSWDVMPEPRRYTPADFGMTFTQWPSITYDYRGAPRLANPQTARKLNIRV